MPSYLCSAPSKKPQEVTAWGGHVFWVLMRAGLLPLVVPLSATPPLRLQASGDPETRLCLSSFLIFSTCVSPSSVCVSPHRVWLEPLPSPPYPVCFPPTHTFPISLLCLFGCLSLWCSPSPVKPKLPFLSLSTTSGHTSPLLLALSDSLHQALSKPSQQTPQHHQPPSVAQ